MSKRAIITGITGQDGSYLAEFLLSKGYEVVGTVRRSSAPNYWRVQHILDRITIKPIAHATRAAYHSFRQRWSDLVQQRSGRLRRKASNRSRVGLRLLPAVARRLSISRSVRYSRWR